MVTYTNIIGYKMFRLKIYTNDNQSFYINVKSLDKTNIMQIAYQQAYKQNINPNRILMPEFLVNESVGTKRNP